MHKKSSLVLAAILAISMLLGACSNETQSSGLASSTSASTDTAAPASQSSSEESAETAEQPRTSLKVEVFDRANENGSDPANNYWTDWIKEQMLKEFNIEVGFESVPRTEEIPKLNVLMASGSPPDIVYTYNGSVAYNYYKQGGLADLTDAIAQYGSTLSNYLGEDLLVYGQYDGRQYLVPAKRISVADSNTFIRKDWLDALGMEMPANMDDFITHSLRSRRRILGTWIVLSHTDITIPAISSSPLSNMPI